MIFLKSGPVPSGPAPPFQAVITSEIDFPNSANIIIFSSLPIFENSSEGGFSFLVSSWNF
jgi:hypothetical protein